MLKRFLLLAALGFIALAATCQAPLNEIRITSSHTSFPDSGRVNGHLYNNVRYDAAFHYEDSSVVILTPRNFRPRKRVDMIFWFHGWNNNIDTALVEYGLSRQFAASRINAVLVLAETARNSPDSYGGKLEQPNTFHELVRDVLAALAARQVISGREKTGHVILAGHSGAYRVMAHILERGNVPVNEVILFDALYANREQFLNWLTASKSHRFIDLYTDHGGTLEETKEMIHQVDSLQLGAGSVEETGVSPRLIRKKRILFIHTTHEHNFIIQNPDNFQRFIDNSPFLKKLK